jgi:CRISPR-associated protein (TIGR02710 family)
MSKAMVMSVGTGVSDDEKAVASLTHALEHSINAAHPDKLFLVLTAESQKKTLPRLEPKLTMPYEVILLDNPDDIEIIYTSLSPRFRDIRKEFSLLTVDYTSGTKAMTSALVLLGTRFEVDNLTYVHGLRKGGIVLPGTEKVKIVTPNFVTAERRIEVAISFFDKCQYDAALAVMEDIRSITSDPRILERIEPLENASKAYSLWDMFYHEKAFAELKQVKLADLEANKRFLGSMLHSAEKEPSLIADLINNAKRRGGVGFKFDDAVARLYRLMELIAQYRLKQYGITDTGRVDLNKIREELRKKWGAFSNAYLELGLHKSYELLESNGDKLGAMFVKDDKLRDLLHKRNYSILAHGLEPVSKAVYEQLLEKTYSYASMAVPNSAKTLNSLTGLNNQVLVSNLSSPEMPD